MNRLLTIVVCIVSLVLSSEAMAFEGCWQRKYQAPVIVANSVGNFYYQVPVVYVQPVVVPVVVRPVIVQEYWVPKIQYVITPVINYEQHYRVFKY